jgi:23S rRNA (adenine2503-C2)-methyltransferase
MGHGFHPVVSTMMPVTHMAIREYLTAWMHLKNTILGGNAGLQLSINTTDETRREQMFSANAMTLRQIAYHTNHLTVRGRKITLNFALTDAPIDAKRLGGLFDPDKFLCKLTPMHLTTTAVDNRLLTGGEGKGYTEYCSYRRVEEDLKREGFDVIVFIPSRKEDESRITCGNAILADGV